MFIKYLTVITGILLPFLGTVVGAGTVWLVPRSRGFSLRNALYGFAAGVMLASLVWSLLIPALDRGVGSSLAGFLCGIGFFLLCDEFFQRTAKHHHYSGTQKMIFAVTLHNLPEGMAVGVAFAGALADPAITFQSAMLLSIGITLQNLPEGSIISTPLSAIGNKKGKAFAAGALSGIVEPIGAILALLLTRLIEGILPFILSFAAGAMLYVVADELIPDLSSEKEKKVGLASLGVGFALMMAMDVIFS